MVEMQDEFETLDDWFIESLKTYKDLHVFQLEHPTQVIEWTSGKTVCVAGYSSSKNEILELRLPLKLFADENKGLCAERDFKVVHGGFTEGPTRCLKHVPGTRCVVTNDGQNTDLQVWDLGGDDSDVIRRTGSVKGGNVSETGSRIAAPPSTPPQVLHGARSSSVQLTQLISGQTLYKLETSSDKPLSSLQFVSDSVFLASCSDGSVYVADARTSAAPQRLPPPTPSDESGVWWTDTSVAPQQADCKLVRLSSSGRAVVSDWRSLGGVVCQAQLDIQTRPHELKDVTVSWAPTLDGYISVSGRCLHTLMQI
ncbi:WD repeat-containing protein 73 [Nematolebias whitei]|uniref:WD repeat-containing protein 73 n=1 Tax=Nematolebias whitei TaxID=451745 RepID=UPI00189788A9|nr:WD repeat-containing protein 73 [Nematolebias whitei]